MPPRGAAGSARGRDGAGCAVLRLRRSEDGQLWGNPLYRWHYLRLHGYGCRFAVEWDDINLQDLVEEAKAELYREQARRLRLENDEREEQT